ncbi:MAG: TIGR00730 family Rossman fold protein [Halobacteriales archaeon]
MDRICVYCGSSPGREPAYRTAAEDFGRMLAARDLRLVYGGGHVGLMGTVADATLDAGGAVHGVIPAALEERELTHEGLTTLEVVDSMHARKERMADLADGFVALPGGFGTLEELLEVLTWAQLGFHQKPCGVLNVADYFGDLAEFFDHQVEEGFVEPEHREMLIVAEEAGALLDAFAAHEPPEVKRFITDEDQT